MEDVGSEELEKIIKHLEESDHNPPLIPIKSCPAPKKRN